jgi:hypothetical protein
MFTVYKGSLEAGFKAWRRYPSKVELLISEESDVKLPLGYSEDAIQI